MAPKILIVEDNGDLCEMLALFLGTLGYEVLQAENSTQGINKALTQKPDLIITDLNLPDMTAVEAAVILKEDPLTSGIPIVILTALSHGEWKNKAREAGVTEYLTKPISPPDLAEKVRSLTNDF
jgi:two-component system, cell cycle response regulator DivK